MPDTYWSQYREMVFAQVRAGRSVYDHAKGLEMSGATIFRWKKHQRSIVGPFFQGAYNRVLVG
jgi:hypothetical protein